MHYDPTSKDPQKIYFIGNVKKITCVYNQCDNQDQDRPLAHLPSLSAINNLLKV